MVEKHTGLPWTKWTGIIIAIIAIVSLSVIFNIPVIRQAAGFFFLTFVPGFLILNIVKLTKLNIVEKVILSMALSLAFVIIFGLMFNVVMLAIGYTSPLSTIPLLISFSVMTVILFICFYLINRNNEDLKIRFSMPGFSIREKFLMLIPLLFPLLSIVGTRVMNSYDNNLILMIFLLLIPAYIIFISIYQRNVTERLYPIILFSISISLLLILSLRSNHIIGSDIHQWYYDFNDTFEKMRWEVLEHSLISSTLSVTILPAIYQAFIKINPEYLFKLLYSVFFSVSPLVVYIISRKYITNFQAFLASIFFMAQFTFLWTAASGNTNLAILFFTLFIMVWFHNDMNNFQKKILFISFIIAAIFSHYSTTFIFFFLVLMTSIGMGILSPILRRITGKSSADTGFGTVQSYLTMNVPVGIAILFFTLIFLWYSQITTEPFKVAVSLIFQSIVNVEKSFVMDAKGTTIAAALGSGISTTPQVIRVIFSWISIGLIALGVLSTLIRYKNMVKSPFFIESVQKDLKSKFEIEFFALTLICSLLMVVAVILPFLPKIYSLERTFFQLLPVLSTFLILGGVMLAKLLRIKSDLVLLIVILTFFLSTSGVTYQLAGYPASIYLNSDGYEYTQWYVHDEDSASAIWLKQYTREGSQIYTNDWPTPRFLLSQGNIQIVRTRLSFITEYKEGRSFDSYMYLSYRDMLLGDVFIEYPDIFLGRHKLYTNGGAEVYR